MKQIIVLRHAHKQGDELTDHGVEHSKVVAQNLDTIHLVITSERNRAMQTAHILTGAEIEIDARANPPAWPDALKPHIRSIQKTHPLGVIGAIWEDDQLVAEAEKASKKLLGLVQETMARIKDGETALIVSHDGVILGLEKQLHKEDFSEPPTQTFRELSGLLIKEDLSAERFSP